MHLQSRNALAWYRAVLSCLQPVYANLGCNCSTYKERSKNLCKSNPHTDSMRMAMNANESMHDVFRFMGADTRSKQFTAAM